MAQAALKESKGELVSKPAEVLPAELAALMGQDAGLGVSHAQEDRLIPLLYVLQTNSPQVNKRDEKYVEGAEAGDIWIRGTDLVIKGDVGLLVQPAWYGKDVGEWIPRDQGGGFVGRHKDMPDDATNEGNDRKPIWVSPRQTEYKETRNHAVLAVTDDEAGAPYLAVKAVVIPLTGSGHTVSKEWTGLMDDLRLPGTNVNPPAWGAYYRLVTKLRTNKDGSWFVLKALHAGKDGQPLFITTNAEYKRGRALFEAFEKGEKVAEAPTQFGGEESSAPAARDDGEPIPF